MKRKRTEHRQHELRRGLIIVRIRHKRTRLGMRSVISVCRIFKNGDTWKDSTRFGRDDLPVLRLILDEAWTFILKTDRDEKAG